MREAFHVTEQVVEWLPNILSQQEIETYKQLAKKGIYRCPYCEAQLIVKYGEKKEVHFSHKHSESCEESRVSEKAEKKYRKQVERETSQHKTIVDIFIDELKVTSKINPSVTVEYGFRAKKDLKFFPDIWLKIDNSEIAITVVTNVNPNDDNSLAKEIEKRHIYFVEHGLHPVWFIENKELAIEKEKNAIVLWEAEEKIALYTREDKKWEEKLNSLVNDFSFFQLYNYKPSMTSLKIEVRSLYYVHSNEEGIIVWVHRFVKDRNVKPFRSFLLNEGYGITFSKALSINEGRLNLSDINIDDNNREHFTKTYHLLIKQHEENERKRKDHEEQLRKKQEKQTELMRQEIIEARKKVMSYSELKVLLRERINLTQPEQQELWSKYMSKIGLKNSQVIWDIVELNDVKSFDELRVFLQG